MVGCRMRVSRGVRGLKVFLNEYVTLRRRGEVSRGVRGFNGIF